MLLIKFLIGPLNLSLPLSLILTQSISLDDKKRKKEKKKSTTSRMTNISSSLWRTCENSISQTLFCSHNQLSIYHTHTLWYFWVFSLRPYTPFWHLHAHSHIWWTLTVCHLSCLSSSCFPNCLFFSLLLIAFTATKQRLHSRLLYH